MKPSKYSIIKKATVGRDSRVYDQVNLYGCKIGKNTKIDSYVYIEEGVTIGDNCKIRPFVFIPTGVVIEDNVFMRAHGKWTRLNTRVKKHASIGAGSTINPGVQIGENALVGAGSVVTKNIPDNAIALGIPAKVVGSRPAPDEPNGHPQSNRVRIVR